ncbi:MAG TPA: aminodeoxychorismate synthase component I [Planctomycetota bacterium]|nr:aminodeoxychorismate synthase component I [Planctomycetota bacterium]
MLKVRKGRRALSSAVAAPADAPEWFATTFGMPFPFLLESAAGGRYTFAGQDPYAILVARGDRLSLWREGRERTFRGDPFDAIRELLAEQKVDASEGVPLPGGAVGAFGYDLGQHLERLPHRAEDDLDFPDLLLGFYDEVTILDQSARTASRVVLEPRPAARAIEPGLYREVFGAGAPLAGRGANFTRERYLAAVARIREYIAAGDVYQVNLSQRFHARSDAAAFDVYRALRSASPAPYAAFLQYGRRAVLSCSPEQFLELRDGRVVTRPIKGTRRRGATPDEDERLSCELMASPKDDAELAMIVDLERNDLGRVCEFGSVAVTAPKVLERHATVLHLSATIEGRVRRGLGSVDVLRAAFPGGSITGAPKIRAMEIIDELEPTRRAFYTGALGALGFDGSMNLSVAIRTVLADGPEYYFQAGGGIVADSDPAAEYEETLTKASAMARALGMTLR